MLTLFFVTTYKEYTPKQAENCSFGSSTIAFIIAQVLFFFDFIILLQSAPRRESLDSRNNEEVPSTNDHVNDENSSGVDEEFMIGYSSRGSTNEGSVISGDALSFDEYSKTVTSKVEDEGLTIADLIASSSDDE